MIKKIFALALLVTILFSCSTSNEVVQNGLFQKRKYNKGWHLNKSTTVKAKKGENIAQTYEKSKGEENNMEDANMADTENKKEKSVSSQFVSTKEETINEVVLFASNNENIKEVISTNEFEAIEADLIKITETKPVEVSKVDKQNSRNDDDAYFILLVILALILPPLAVYLIDGMGNTFWLSVVLTLLFWIPGVVYAMIRVFS